MSQLQQVFSDIANSIRSKLGGGLQYKPTEMSDAIDDIEAAVPITLNTAVNTVTKAFNAPIFIDGNVSGNSAAYSIQNFDYFNAPITFSDAAINVQCLMNHCPQFQRDLTIPNSIVNATRWITNVPTYSGNLTVESNSYYINNIFYNCGRVSGHLNLSQSQPESMGITYTQYLGTSNIIGSITFSKPVLTNAFVSSNTFNAKVIIQNASYKYSASLYHAFYYCNNFNKPVILEFPSSQGNAMYMFGSCPKFNQPMNIPGIRYMDGMFYECTNLNSQVNITSPVYTASISYMFSNCVNLRVIPNLYNAIFMNGQYAFMNCYNLPPGDIQLRTDWAANAYGMFTNCFNFSGNIYFNGYVSDCTRIFYGKQTNAMWRTKRINVYFNHSDSWSRILTYNYNLVDNSYPVTWTNANSTCYYNTYYNIYCYKM